MQDYFGMAPESAEDIYNNKKFKEFARCKFQYSNYFTLEVNGITAIIFPFSYACHKECNIE